MAWHNHPWLGNDSSVVHCEARRDDASAVSGSSLDSQETIYSGDLDASECWCCI